MTFKRFLYYLVFFTGVTFVRIGSAQPNLVPNPGFESIHFYPDTTFNPGIFDSCHFVQGVTWHFKEWKDIPQTTALWTFNECSYYDYGRLPNTVYGYQETHSGKTMIGIGTYYHNSLTPQITNPLYRYRFRNFPNVKLNKTLKKNKTYCAEIFINSSDTNKYSCNNFGFYFSQEDPTVLFNDSMDIKLALQQVIPQIRNNPLTNPLFSKTEWMRIHGSFLAQGNESYVSIGNFDLQEECVSNIYPENITPSNTGYFLDDISVIELRALASDKDTIELCLGGSVNVAAYNSYANIMWSTGQTGYQITLSSPGLYWVSGQNECGAVTDTFFVKTVPPENYLLNLGNNLQACEKIDTTLVNTNPFLNTIIWNFNDTAQNFRITQPGTYIVSAPSPCGLKLDTIIVQVFPLPDNFLLKDTVVCLGKTLKLMPNMAFKNYYWFNADTLNHVIITQNGNYTLSVTDFYGCTNTDTASVFFEQVINKILFDTAVYNYNLPIDINIPDGFLIEKILFNNSPVPSFSSAGIYDVFLRDNENCLIKNTVEIKLISPKLLMPSVVKSSNDFFVYGVKQLDTFQIFDAAGRLIINEQNFKSEKLTPLSSGLYLIYCEYENENGKIISEKRKLIVCE